MLPDIPYFEEWMDLFSSEAGNLGILAAVKVQAYVRNFHLSV
jgi:hypothetical protein